jgi:2'-hydroxyisoflavone reductase
VSEKALNGSFNLSGVRLTWTDFVVRLGARNIVWVPAEVIRANGVTEFELPLYRKAGGPRSSLMHVSHERAIAAGLKLTPLETTANDVREWLAVNKMPPALSREREAALIDASRRATH